MRAAWRSFAKIFLIISGECCICCELVERGGCTANGKTYHQQCFKCSNCRNILQDKFFTADDQPLCELCYKVPSQNIY